MAARIDITGQRFGNLVALEFHSFHGSRRCIWRCACDCGGETYATSTKLKNGLAKSCCGNPVRITHGMTKTRTYRIWSAMLTRIRNPSPKDKKNYSDRGITVSERWLSFEGFLADMGVAPDGMSIDRIENGKGYEAGNCKWSTVTEQNNNRRNTLFLSMDGITKPSGDWSRETGIPISVIHGRKRSGWSDEKSLTTQYSKRK